MDVDQARRPKRARTDDVVPREEEKKKRKDKGRACEGEFRAVRASVHLSIPPVFTGRAREGAEEMLDSMIMRCAAVFLPSVRLQER